MIKAVLFDFDETLQDRTEAFEHYMDAFLDKYCPQIPDDEKERRKVDMRITGMGGYVNRVDWYSHLCEMWDWKNAPSAQELANHYDRTFGDHNVIFKNSEPLLKELKARGYIVGVITNGPSKLQNHKMDNSGLRKYCDIVVVSGDVGIHKPNKGLFQYTADKLGLSCDECVYVGDHPVNDIEGSLEAGMHAIRMNYGWFKNQDLRPDVPVIDDIISVLNYV
jgi:putative hydrolase of the HAD superfamily